MSTWVTLFSVIAILHSASTELDPILPHVEVIYNHTLNSHRIIIKTVYFEKIEDVHEDGTIFGECVYKFNEELKSISYIVTNQTFFFLGGTRPKDQTEEIVQQEEYSPLKDNFRGASTETYTSQNSYEDYEVLANQFRIPDHLSFRPPYPLQAHLKNVASITKHGKIFRYSYENTAHIQSNLAETDVDNTYFNPQENEKISIASEENFNNFKNCSENHNITDRNTQKCTEKSSPVKSDNVPFKNSTKTDNFHVGVNHLEHQKTNAEIDRINSEQNGSVYKPKRNISNNDEQEENNSGEITTSAASFTNQLQKSDADPTNIPEEFLLLRSKPNEGAVISQSTEGAILNMLSQENHDLEQNIEKESTSKESVLVISVPVVELVQVDFVLTKGRE